MIGGRLRFPPVGHSDLSKSFLRIHESCREYGATPSQYMAFLQVYGSIHNSKRAELIKRQSHLQVRRLARALRVGPQSEVLRRSQGITLNIVMLLHVHKTVLDPKQFPITSLQNRKLCTVLQFFILPCSTLR